jgi:hypothetical protein
MHVLGAYENDTFEFIFRNFLSQSVIEQWVLKATCLYDNTGSIYWYVHNHVACHSMRKCKLS